jgi:RND family efflux transporter MFP subunit
VASEVEGLVVAFTGREGRTVRKGEPLVQLRKDHVELRLVAARAQLREAEARRTLAEQNRARARELFASQVLSRGQLDDSRSEFDAWQGRVEQLSAEIARIELELERSAIVAPFAGVVVAERTEVGEWVGRGDPVVELVSLHDLEVHVDVPERYFGTLRPGAPARISFDALPGADADGTITTLVPRANREARTFPAKIRIRSPEGQIGVGMLAQVSFSIGDARRATMVPKDAVIIRGEQRFVFQVNGDSKVDQVAVETGTGVGDWVELRGGAVTPGVKVITRGNERLQSGQEVEAEPLEYTGP